MEFFNFNKIEKKFIPLIKTIDNCIKEISKDIIDREGEGIIEVNGKKNLFIDRVDFTKGEKKIEEMVNLISEESCFGLVFNECIITNENLNIPSMYSIYFYKCNISNFKVSYFDKEHNDENGKIYFIESNIKGGWIKGIHTSLFFYKKEGGEDSSSIKVKECRDLDISIIDRSEALINLIIEESKNIKLIFKARNKFITLLNDESISFSILYYNIQFKNYAQIRAFKEVTSKHYRYLKSTYNEERFSYYELLKSLEFKMAKGSKRLRKIFFRIFTGYLISPIRILVISAIIIFCCGLLYIFTGFEVIDVGIYQVELYNFHNMKWSVLFKALYLSVITFTTVGYGNIIPVGYGEVVSIFEMITGAIYISLFTGSLFKRYMD